jgi:hypothetical protein
MRLRASEIETTTKADHDMRVEGEHDPTRDCQTNKPFWTRSCAADILGFFFAAASSFFLTDQSCRADAKDRAARQASKGGV